MRLTKKRIDEAIAYACGNDVLKLVDRLRRFGSISEFKLVELLKEDVKRVRNMLYRLYEANLVSFSRTKDKKKGWYIYHWSFNPEQVKYLFTKMKQEMLERLHEKLKSTEEVYYVCPNECVRISFDQAVNFEYHCPECGTVVEAEDRSTYIAGIQQKIAEIEKELR